MKETGIAAQGLQELVARIRRQIAVQKDLSAKVREKRTGIRSGSAALTGIRGSQKGRASPPACAAGRGWCA